MKKIVIVLLCLVLNLTIVNAASNPYKMWQTIDGVKTVRCTYYAWQQAYDKTGVALPGMGNAKTWYDSAKKAGYSVGSTAKPNSIAVWTDSTYGHVAFVVSVEGEYMTVNEAGIMTYDESGTLIAYNGNGILNGASAYTIVNEPRSIVSNQTLVGFIYLTEPKTNTTADSEMTTPNDTVTQNTHAHEYGEWTITKDATCEEAGAKERTCNSCGKKQIKEIAKTEHTFVDWETIVENGYEKSVRTCEVCSYKEEKDVVEHQCDFGDWKIIKEPTTEEEGIKERTCIVNRCDNKETEIIPLLVAETIEKDNNNLIIIVASMIGVAIVAAITIVIYKKAKKLRKNKKES